MDIARNSENISVPGHRGTWHTIDHATIYGKEYFLMEHDKYGDEAGCVIIDKQGKLVLDDVYNGFDDLHYLLEEKQYRLFVDMDGTLAEFKRVDRLETLYEKGYFANLNPMENVVQAIKHIIGNHPEIEVFILSAYLPDSAYALDEKKQWLDRYLPEIDSAHRVFCPCGEDKSLYVPGEMRDTDWLLDDYTKNLLDWEPMNQGIKLLNGINHSNGTWQGQRIRFDRSPQDLAESIVKAVSGQQHLVDEKPISSKGCETAAQILGRGYEPYYDKDKLYIFKNPKTGGYKFFTAAFGKNAAGNFETKFTSVEELKELHQLRHLMPDQMRLDLERAMAKAQPAQPIEH